MKCARRYEVGDGTVERCGKPKGHDDEHALLLELERGAVEAACAVMIEGPITADEARVRSANRFLIRREAALVAEVERLRDGDWTSIETTKPTADLRLSEAAVRGLYSVAGVEVGDEIALMATLAGPKGSAARLDPDQCRICLKPCRYMIVDTLNGHLPLPGYCAEHGASMPTKSAAKP